MNLKEELIATDLHVHGWTFPEKVKGEWIVSLLEGRLERTADALVKVSQNKFPEEPTLVGLVNFDNRTTYEMIVKTLYPPLNVDLIYDDFKKTFFGIKKGDLWRYFIRVQEVPTDQGHVLLVGACKNTQRRKLIEVLKEAKEETGALIIAPHPLSAASIPFIGKRLDSFLSKGGQLSLGEENLIKYSSYWDGIEVESSKYSSENRTSSIAVGLMSPQVVSSDSEGIENFLGFGMYLNGVDFANSETLRASLRNSIRNCSHYFSRANNKSLERLNHGLVSMYNSMRLKTGMLKREVHEIE